MSVYTREPGKQAYTLICKHPDSNQLVICSAGTDAVYTTDLESLVIYARHLAKLYPIRTYTISTVNPYKVMA